ncbi:hypothetical protein [Shewanella algae]|uniref:hypothetical protein n=1 Tax=Shewanella algae TaxID=38313 RepID=UPI00399A8D6E
MKPSELSEAIHNDGPLAGKRRLLVGLSMVLIAIYFTGAKVSEASTPFLKITFANVGGLSNLLLICTGFVLVRYYSYSSVYQQQVTNAWASQLLEDSFFYKTCIHSDQETGYVVDIAPQFAGFNDEEIRHNEQAITNHRFLINWLVNAQIEYSLFIPPDKGKTECVNVFNVKRRKDSVKALKLIAKYWWDAQVRYRESLDIYAPYFIAFMAIGLTICPILFG